MPIEFICSGLFIVVLAWEAPIWATVLVGVPLGVLNIRSFLRKDHKLYFITRREYQTSFKRMENHFKIKSVYYGILTAGSLVMMILALIDFMERLVS
jgi:uncharacterized pyridoxamine 5'-phosphate oxidase family protein